MHKLIIRVFDIIFSFIGLIFLLPAFAIIGCIICLESKGGILFIQQRVGKGNRDFNLYKFRTMLPESSKKGLITIGIHDSRITKVGKFLRKYKLDELPQLLNVLKGDMSMVGPRPEVRKYVNKYSRDQMQILTVRPGITDLASIEYIDENEILSQQENPEMYYIDVIMPNKISLNMHYVERINVQEYFFIIIKTFIKILFR